jgi:MYXO-CTERM domain-containing protein
MDLCLCHTKDVPTCYAACGGEPLPPPAAAGASGSSGSSGAANESGGCGCATPGEQPRGAGLAVLVGLGASVLRRRRGCGRANG